MIWHWFKRAIKDFKKAFTYQPVFTIIVLLLATIALEVIGGPWFVVFVYAVVLGIFFAVAIVLYAIEYYEHIRETEDQFAYIEYLALGDIPPSLSPSAKKKYSEYKNHISSFSFKIRALGFLRARMFKYSLLGYLRWQIVFGSIQRAIRDIDRKDPEQQLAEIARKFLDEALSITPKTSKQMLGDKKNYEDLLEQKEHLIKEERCVQEKIKELDLQLQELMQMTAPGEIKNKIEKLNKLLQIPPEFEQRVAQDVLRGMR